MVFCEAIIYVRRRFLFIEIFIHQFIFHLYSFLHSIVVVVVVVRVLRRHMLKRLRQTLFNERQFSHRPDLSILSPSSTPISILFFQGQDRETYRLQILLNLTIQRPRLDSNDFRRSVRIMRYWAPAFRTENAMDVLAGGALAGPRFGGAG